MAKRKIEVDVLSSEEVPVTIEETSVTDGLDIRDSLASEICGFPSTVDQNNRIVQVQWFDDHFYKVALPDGTEEYYPSVTTVLGMIMSQFLVRWRADVGNEEADRRLHEAGRRGSRIHHACDIMEQGGAIIFNDFRRPVYSRQEIIDIETKYPVSMVLSEQAEMYQVLKYRKWLDAVNPKLVAAETMVADPEIQSAGTLDRVYYIEEGVYHIAGKTPLKLKAGLYLADIKSSNEIDEKYYKQIATYAKMYAKAYEVEFAGGLIIHTNSKVKNGIEGLTTVLRTPEEMNEDYNSYLDIYKVWKHSNPDPRPKVFSFPSMLTLSTEL